MLIAHQAGHATGDSVEEAVAVVPPRLRGRLEREELACVQRGSTHSNTRGGVRRQAEGAWQRCPPFTPRATLPGSAARPQHPAARQC